jgi:hypothetical protein
MYASILIISRSKKKLGKRTSSAIKLVVAGLRALVACGSS